MAKTKETSPVSVDVTIVDGFAVAAVKYDGLPVEAEVQWWPKTPYQKAPEGICRVSTTDPRTFALSAARYSSRPPCNVTARVMVDNDYVYSDPVEVDINERGKAQ
ncbi:MAG: hypothetical protein ABFD49_11165 [Armatimonadota bacterium]|nr:hypothetical protein [bacterium]